MSYFYTTLGNALFGADFRSEMSKIKAAAARRRGAQVTEGQGGARRHGRRRDGPRREV